MRNSIFATSLIASLGFASVVAHADPVDDAVAAAAPAKPQGWQADVRTISGVSDTGTGGAVVLGAGVDVGKRTGDVYVGGSADVAAQAAPQSGWGGSLARASVELRDYVYDQPGVAANCFGAYPVRREIYVGGRVGGERAEDAFENEDLGVFGELTLGGTVISDEASVGVYVSIGASAKPSIIDAPMSPATSIYAMTGFQLTFS
jgi:hypothetical protein